MKQEWQQVGEIGVDAGMVMVGDPSYVADINHPARDWKKFCDTRLGDEQLNYSDGRAGLGVVVSSGYGDGTYPVYIKRNRDGAVSELKVVLVDFESVFD